MTGEYDRAGTARKSGGSFMMSISNPHMHTPREAAGPQPRTWCVSGTHPPTHPSPPCSASASLWDWFRVNPHPRTPPTHTTPTHAPTLTQSHLNPLQPISRAQPDQHLATAAAAAAATAAMKATTATPADPLPGPLLSHTGAADCRLLMLLLRAPLRPSP